VKCPECGTWADVLETRRTPKGETRRRYECANGHRFTTYERYAESKKTQQRKDGENE
jgi:transcriptional regulator NrdR family protein